jgi:hypothetical protein
MFAVESDPCIGGAGCVPNLVRRRCVRLEGDDIAAQGGDDAIRSLVTSYKLLGTREWFVIHHTDCGMLLFKYDDMRKLLASSLKTATLDQSGWHDSGPGPGSTEGDYINWLTFSDNARPAEPARRDAV